MKANGSLALAGLLAFLLFAPTTTETVAEEFCYPVAVVASKSGAVYVADRGLPGIWRLDDQLASLHFLAAKQIGSPLSAIRCLAIDEAGRLLAGDSSTRHVYRFDEQRQPHTLTAAVGGFGQIEIPMDIEVGTEGNLLVSDLEAGQIVEVIIASGEVRPWVAVPAPRGLFLDTRGEVWVISGQSLLRITAAGTSEIVVDKGVFQHPNDVAVDEGGVAYVSDSHARTIWRIRPGDKPESWIQGPPLDCPVGMAYRGGKLLVADSRARAILEIELGGGTVRRLGDGVQPLTE